MWGQWGVHLAHLKYVPGLGMGISVLVFGKKKSKCACPAPHPPISIASVYSTTGPKLHVWLPADVSLQRLAAVLAGYRGELRQLTPEQLSTLLTLLQLLPKGTGRNLGECPVREACNPHLHGGYCRESSWAFSFSIWGLAVV